MEPSAIIESYVDDVIRRLPRRLQGDVGLELRSLLSDELDATARDAARPVDDAMTLALLREGQVAVGTWLQLHSPAAARLLAAQGLFDWMLVDFEHTPVDLGDRSG